MTEQQWRIRPMTADDKQIVVELDRQSTGEVRTGFFDRRMRAMVANPAGYIALVAENDAGVAGFVMSCILTGEFGSPQPVALLDALSVQQGVRGGGIGMTLMEELKSAAAVMGCGEFRTQIDWRAPELLAYFANSGFRLVPCNILERGTATKLVRPGSSAETDESGTDPAESEAGGHNPGEPRVASVRSLQESDLAAIQRIDKRTTGNDRKDYLRRKVSEVLSDSGIRVSMVAEIDSMVVGFIMARVDYGEFGRAETMAVIDTVGVDPGFRGAGAGFSLMRQLVDNLASLRVEQMRTVVDWDDFDLNRFLSRCGFKPAQRLGLGCRV